jgi:hypothetical protein
MKALSIIVASLLMVGCQSNGKIYHDTSLITNKEIENTEKIFAGVPVLLSMEGSTARLDENWVVTAAHNKPIFIAQGKLDVIYHPTCDIAIYRSKGDNTVKVGTAYNGDTVNHVGYPMGLPMSVSQGQIVGSVNMEEYPECTMVATTGTIAKGMSGGGVYNDAGELIGINQGFADSDMVWPDGTKLSNGGVYMHLSTVKDWLKEHTGVDYFK